MSNMCAPTIANTVNIFSDLQRYARWSGSAETAACPELSLAEKQPEKLATRFSLKNPIAINRYLVSAMLQQAQKCGRYKIWSFLASFSESCCQ